MSFARINFAPRFSAIKKLRVPDTEEGHRLAKEFQHVQGAVVAQGLALYVTIAADCYPKAFDYYVLDKADIVAAAEYANKNSCTQLTHPFELPILDRNLRTAKEMTELKRLLEGIAVTDEFLRPIGWVNLPELFKRYINERSEEGKDASGNLIQVYKADQFGRIFRLNEEPSETLSDSAIQREKSASLLGGFGRWVRQAILAGYLFWSNPVRQ